MSKATEHIQPTPVTYYVVNDEGITTQMTEEQIRDSQNILTLIDREADNVWKQPSQYAFSSLLESV